MQFRPLLVLASFGFASGQEVRHSWQRNGVFHSRVEGRVVDQRGAAISGAIVHIIPGSRRSSPLAETVTGSTGRFQFDAVNWAGPVAVAAHASGQFSPSSVLLPSRSMTTVALGDLVLPASRTFRVYVHTIGPPPPADCRDYSASLAGSGESDRRFTASRRGRLHIFTGVMLAQATLEISCHGRNGERYETSVDLAGDAGGDYLDALLHRDTLVKQQYFQEGKLTVTRMPAPPSGPQEPVSGRLLWPDGTPAAGVILSWPAAFLSEGIPTTRRTGTDGRFELEPGRGCRPIVTQLQTASLPPAPNENCGALGDVTLEGALRLGISVEGAPPGVVPSLSYWSNIGWQPLPGPETWALRGYQRRITIRADLPGFLPAIGAVEYPAVSFKPAENAPKPGDLRARVRFGAAQVRELRVVSGGKPIDATIDVELIEDLRARKRLPLRSWRTDAAGSLRLAGSAELVEAFVYAKGFEPKRLIWNPGAAEIVELRPLDAALAVPVQRRGYRVRASFAGTTTVAGEASSDGITGMPIALPVGEFDVTLFDETGQARATELVSFTRGGTATTAFANDQRPRVRVRCGKRASAGVSRGPAPGQSAGFMMYSVMGGSRPPRDTGVVFVERNSTETIFRLTGTGRHEVSCHGPEPSYMTFSRFIDAAPGSETVVEMPEIKASLAGSMRTYRGDTMRSHHGVAGPRMALVPRDPSGWTVTLQWPKRRSDDRFVLDGLPAGEYAVFQHLIGEQKTYESGGTKHEYTVPIAAWGGIPVRLEPGKTAKLRDFVDYPRGKLTIAISGQDGRPLATGTVRLLDRMRSAWSVVEEGPTTLRDADHPIPEPPAARIVQGRVEFDSIRSGRLAFTVERDDGRIQTIERDVNPGQVLEVRLP